MDRLGGAGRLIIIESLREMCRGVLKLCDMGLARYFKPEDAAYTPRVVTLWCAFVFA